MEYVQVKFKREINLGPVVFLPGETQTLPRGVANSISDAIDILGPSTADQSLSGAPRSLVSGAGITGFAPQTRDYAGVMAAIRQAHSSVICRNVVFEDAEYDLGSNYLPIVGGVGYYGPPPRMTYTNGDWTDRNLRPLSGARFRTTHDYTFWDGAVDQASVTPTVADQTCATVADSPNISVPNSALFPVGSRVYTPADAAGFMRGTSYFVLSSAANVITLGLADKTAMVASSTGALTIARGKPNDGSTHVVMDGLVGLSCKTFIKCGAANTFGFVHSKLRNLYAFGGSTKRTLFDVTNYAQSEFERIYSFDGDGQYWGCNYPLGTFIPGNSDFKHLFNATNGAGSSALVQRGIRFQCENGSNLNEVHAYNVQNNNGAVTTQTQTATTTAASTDIAVTDGTQYPVDMPVWFSAVGSNTTVYADLIYFVTYQSGNTIRVSASKGAAAVTPDWSGSTTINCKGFPSMEVVAVGNGYITSSQFDGLDLEGDAGTHLLLQQTSHTDIGVLQCAADQAKWGITGRTFSGVLRNMFQKTTSDLDKNCRAQWIGNRTGTTAVSQSYGGFGMWYDANADMVALSMHHDSVISGGVPVNKPLLWGMKPSPFPWAKANFPIGLVQYTQDTTKSFTGSSPVGHIIFNGAAGQTFTLPTIVDAATRTSMVGYEFWFTNASSNSLAIATSSSQTMNNIAAKTTTTLAANTHARFIASKTSGGALFWTVFISAALP